MPTTAADYPKYGNLHIRPAERPTIGLILLMGMMLSFATAWLAQQAEYNRQKDLLAQQSERFNNDLTTTFDMNMELLSGLRGLYLASNNVEMDEFILYSQPILLGHPEIQLLAWAPRLTSADLLVHEIKMRSQNAPSYALHPGRDPNTNALLRSEYFPISYLSPTIGNEHYLGLDMAAYPALQIGRAHV